VRSIGLARGAPYIEVVQAAATAVGILDSFVAIRSGLMHRMPGGFEDTEFRSSNQLRMLELVPPWFAEPHVGAI
jgi:hypothetical protein